jgi:cyclase
MAASKIAGYHAGGRPEAPAARRGADRRPVRYLVNTTYHGDHTFGNVGFPSSVTIVSSRANRDSMKDLQREKSIRSESMYGDDALLDEVTAWRTPDLVFDSSCEIDLGGGQIVRLYSFGPGNGPGDTVVYVPSARAAWTGNFVSNGGVAMLLQGGPSPYIESLRRMRATLPELETIVPGHGPVGNGPIAVSELIAYLERLDADVRAAVRAGRSLEETYAVCADPFAIGLPESLITALTGYDLPQDLARAGFRDLARHLHRLNILVAYRTYENRLS